MSDIRILLADDHAVMREGLKMLINSQPGMKVIAEAGDGPTAVDRADEFDPDVAVVDVSMPGLNGAQVTERMRAARPDRKVLALTVHEDKNYLRMLLEAGAVGYVLKRAAAAELVQAIRAVAAGGTYLDPTVAGSVVGVLARRGADDDAQTELSGREVEVLRLLALGYSNKEIAARLKLSVKTVETYKSRSMEKLGLRSRVDLIQHAAQCGWLGSV